MAGVSPFLRATAEPTGSLILLMVWQVWGETWGGLEKQGLRAKKRGHSPAPVTPRMMAAEAASVGGGGRALPGLSGERFPPSLLKCSLRQQMEKDRPEAWVWTLDRVSSSKKL